MTLRCRLKELDEELSDGEITEKASVVIVRDTVEMQGKKSVCDSSDTDTCLSTITGEGAS